MSDRDDLEMTALETVSEGHYHVLEDTVSGCTDKQLERIIACGGDYQAELDVLDDILGIEAR